MPKIKLVRSKNDILLTGTATWFGGANDPLDNGETASGINTRRNSRYMGCALPMNFSRACRLSPLPRLPWQTKVEVKSTKTGLWTVVRLIDVGPADWAKDVIDLTQPAFKVLGHDLVEGFFPVEVRIIGCAELIDWPESVQANTGTFDFAAWFRGLFSR